MAVEVDIFNPQESVIAHGLEGKTILIYGGNATGKTYNCARADKAYFFACESGLNGQSGVKYNRITNWYDFKKAVGQFTNPKTIDKAKELYHTIVIDEVYASAIFCQDYICQKLGITAFGENGNSKINAWQEYEKEYWREINKLVNSGFTIIFIAHAENKDGYTYPRGDKRCLEPIINNCDIVAFVKSNGVDENGRCVHSSAYFLETKDHFARSRYTYIVPMIQDFTMENFTNAIEDAIQKEVEATGVKTVDFATQVAQNETKQRSYEELMGEVQSLGEEFANANRYEELVDIVEKTLGAGKKASELKKGQEQIIQVLIDNLKEVL